MGRNRLQSQRIVRLYCRLIMQQSLMTDDFPQLFWQKQQIAVEDRLKVFSRFRRGGVFGGADIQSSPLRPYRQQISATDSQTIQPLLGQRDVMIPTPFFSLYFHRITPLC